MTTSTNTSVTSQPLMSIASTKTSINLSPVKTTVSQGKKPIGKWKTTKPMDKLLVQHLIQQLPCQQFLYPT